MVRKKGQVQKGSNTMASGRKGGTWSKRHRPKTPGQGSGKEKRLWDYV